MEWQRLIGGYAPEIPREFSQYLDENSANSRLQIQVLSEARCPGFLVNVFFSNSLH